MDSIVVTLSNPLAPGDYTLQIRKGADNNTLLDNCDAAVRMAITCRLVFNLQSLPRLTVLHRLHAHPTF
jgi:hypothetical protein